MVSLQQITRGSCKMLLRGLSVTKRNEFLSNEHTAKGRKHEVTGHVGIAEATATTSVPIQLQTVLIQLPVSAACVITPLQLPLRIFGPFN
jgi:hypothetical protein